MDARHECGGHAAAGHRELLDRAAAARAGGGTLAKVSGSSELGPSRPSLIRLRTDCVMERLPELASAITRSKKSSSTYKRPVASPMVGRSTRVPRPSNGSPRALRVSFVIFVTFVVKVFFHFLDNLLQRTNKRINIGTQLVR